MNTQSSVNGIGVGAIGADKFSADGEVFNLHSAHDIEGTYTALNASATAVNQPTIGAFRRRAAADAGSAGGTAIALAPFLA